MQKKINFTALILVFAVLFSSCAKKNYRDDISCAELADNAAKAAEDAGEYAKYDADFLKYNFADTNIPRDFAIAYTVETNNINEIGVFRAPDKNSVTQLKALVISYLDTMRSEKTAFIASYAPEEVPKLSDAEVKTFGKYVVYLILDKEDRDRAFAKIEEMLSK